jgi:Family of unknown function (DUF6677)
LAKTDRERREELERAPSRAWAMGFLGWFLPGFGHLMQGKRIRALLLGGTIWTCFITGLAMGGHMFGLTSSDPSSSVLLQVPPMIANLGAGLPYIGSWLLGAGFDDDPMQAARATFEYGNTFLLIAGLLNYLAMLDAFDIAAGRKS